MIRPKNTKSIYGDKMEKVGIQKVNPTSVHIELQRNTKRKTLRSIRRLIFKLKCVNANIAFFVDNVIVVSITHSVPQNRRNIFFEQTSIAIDDTKTQGYIN